MAFTYDPSGPTDRDRLRRKLSDTDANRHAFEDEELDAILSEEGSLAQARIEAIRTLLTDKARRTRAMSLDGVTYNDAAAVAGLQTLLASLGGDTGRMAVVRTAATPMDRGFVEPIS